MKIYLCGVLIVAAMQVCVCCGCGKTKEEARTTARPVVVRQQPPTPQPTPPAEVKAPVKPVVPTPPPALVIPPRTLITPPPAPAPAPQPKPEPVVERYRYAGMVRTLLPTDKPGVYQMELEDRQTTIKTAYCTLNAKPNVQPGQVVEVSGVIYRNASIMIWMKDVKIENVVQRKFEPIINKVR